MQSWATTIEKPSYSLCSKTQALKHLLSILLITCLSIALYASALKNGFVYDDNETIVNNALIKDFANLPKLFQVDYFEGSGEATFRPVVTFSYFIDYALFGLSPWGFHLTNIILHAVNGILLYTFLTLLIREPECQESKTHSAHDKFKLQPLIISLLFITNPVLTEAVNAISYREDLLTFFFYMATLNLYLILRSNLSVVRNTLWFCLLLATSCLLYFLALLSKEMALTLPLIVYCYEWIYAEKNKRSLHTTLSNAGYIAVTLIYVYLRFFCFRNPGVVESTSWGLMERLLTTPWILIHYFKITLFPVSLSADYVIAPVKSPVSLAFILPLMMVILVLTASVLLRKRNKGLTFGILFFIITLIPVYNVIPIANPFAERYLYLPLCGFAVITGSFIYLIYETLYFKGKIANRYLMMSLFTLLSIFSLTVIKRNGVWNTDQMLWADTVKKVPSSYRAHIGIGVALTYHGKFDEAIREFKTAAGLNPSYLEAHYNLGNVYYIVGRIEESIEEFKATVRLNPYYFNAQNNLGVVYYKMGRLDEAIPPLETALRLNPRNPKFHADLANAYAQKGKLDEAHKHYQTALMLNPGLVWINYKLRDLSLKKGIK